MGSGKFSRSPRIAPDAFDGVERRQTDPNVAWSGLERRRHRFLVIADAVRYHGAAVKAAARRIVRDQSLAEDVAQEVFVDLWNHPDRFDPARGTLRGFLLMRSRSRSRDAVRSLSRRAKREALETSMRLPLLDDPENGESQDGGSGGTSRALAALSPRHREVVELAYYSNLSYEQISSLLHIPQGTVKSRMYHAMRAMRVALAT